MNSDANDTINRSSERTGGSPKPLDDAQLGSLIRDVASGWELPPVRLDQEGWRDRVRSPRSRRAETLSGWLGRVGRAATAAIALTVVAALVAVYLTRPPQFTGTAPASASPAPSGSTRRPSAEPSPTPLPKLFVAGSLPRPSRVIVQTEASGFAALDLSTGTTGKPLTDSTFGSQVRTLASGKTVCLCIQADTPGAGGENTHVTVSLIQFDFGSDAGMATPKTVLDLRGEPDPRDGEAASNAGNVSASVTLSPDGTFGYVGWSARAHPSWTSGIVVVRLDTEAIVQRLQLPTVSDGSGANRTYVDAPHVVGRAGAQALIDRNRYDYSPIGVENPVFDESSDLFVAQTLPSGSFQAPALLPNQPCAFIAMGGGLANGEMWVACSTQYGEATAIHRLAADGSRIGSTPVDDPVIDGTTSVISADGTALYLWNPQSLSLTKVDLAKGTKTTANAAVVTSSASGGGPLSGLGEWLAPSAAAKMFFSPGIALSPDGSRIYAIGANEGSTNGGDLSGSGGVAVFDTASMQPVATWPATADFDSIALNADGSSIFLLGMPDVRADGSQDRRQRASLTVLDATSGSVQLVAGELGGEMLTFAEPVLGSR
jgi:hypothetical protein